MASIITSILSKSVGLLFNKARDKTADKLKDGDITDAKIRDLIVRELNDVKSKLEGLSRSHLLTSYDFLREGVNLLKVCLDKSEETQRAVLNETHDDGGETSTKPSNAESTGILTEALTLSQAIGKVKINSDEEFESAKKRFKDARKEATRAFNNDALSIKDRIFAAKLQIVSEQLEFLESPDTAIINCLPFLEKLHGLPAIREIFSVYINGGYKSMVGKAERVENVKAVMLINYVLFQFVLQFSSKYYSAITWPTIELAGRSFRPILDWQEVSTRGSWGEKFIQPPNKVIPNKRLPPSISAVNGHGEVIFPESGGNINVTSRTGEVKMVKLNYPGDGEAINRDITKLAVDGNNNVYVLMHLETRTVSGVVRSYVLYVFDENYDLIQNCTLPFLDAKLHPLGDIAINKNNDIVINIFDGSHMYVCDNAGQLKHKFKPDRSYIHKLTTSDKNEILFASRDLKTVYRYTEKGDLESTIKVPEGHLIHSVAFNYVLCKIMLLTFVEESYSHFLLRYCETGKLECSYFLWKDDERIFRFVASHPSGPAVVLTKRSITYI